MGYTPPLGIDMGSPAIVGAADYPAGYTIICKANPANRSGKITTIEIYVSNNLSNVEVGTFFVVSGDNLSTRDTQTIGTVTSGAKRTFTVDLDVEVGDYIGFHYTAGDGLYYDATGGNGSWYRSGDHIPCTNQVFSVGAATTRKFSIYGIGYIGVGELTIGESFSATDSLVKNATKQLAEAIHAVDTLVKNVIKQLSEAFSAVDSWVARISFNEAFSTADSVVKNGTEQLAEAFSFVDSKVTKISKAVSEAIGIADSIVKSASHALAEAIGIVDSIVRKMTLLFSESIGVVDTITTSAIRRLTEAVGLADAFRKSIHWVQEIKEALEWTEELKNTITWTEETKGEDDWTEEVKI